MYFFRREKISEKRSRPFRKALPLIHGRNQETVDRLFAMGKITFRGKINNCALNTVTIKIIKIEVVTQFLLDLCFDCKLFRINFYF